MRTMDDRAVSNLFKRFYGSDLCDRLLKVRGLCVHDSTYCMHTFALALSEMRHMSLFEY